ncbi:hypothetical protein AVEN_67930-1 [Araneus ventricosus]|uniref:Transposable element Tc1 transposase n=1 Tax=Araneus ventricosus TaxID=182803 RepID=A0A4Y2QUK9_ARAVE|nr:hypothetical protein AVEN_67930-1 [Araneus ventricosus]
MDQWATVLFTDESRFTLNTDSRRTFIWREPGSRYLSSNVLEIDHYGGVGLMVWADIMLDGRTPLHVFERGAVTGVRYRDEILEPYVRLFRGAVGLSTWGKLPALEQIMLHNQKIINSLLLYRSFWKWLTSQNLGEQEI